MKQPVLTRRHVGTMPAEWDRKRLGWRCPFCPQRRGRPVLPVIGDKCDGCGAKVTELYDFDPFADRRPRG